MTQKVITLFVLLIVIFMSQNVYSQFNNFDCGFVSSLSGENLLPGNLYGLKPTRTNYTSDPYEAFPVLVVFVQFKDEEASPRGVWPKGDINNPGASKPIFLDSLIATQKNTIVNTPFWELYNPNTERISSRWAEISRGKFHVISPQGAFSVVLPKKAKDYWYDAYENEHDCEFAINRDIWATLIAQGLTDWRDYDRWKFLGYNQFEYCTYGNGDGFVDMIYKVHKSPGYFTDNNNINRTALYNKAGYSKLGSFSIGEIDEIDPNHTIYIDYGGGGFGSGITLSFKATATDYIAAMSHEHLHYMTYSVGHVTYSNCAYGIGLDYFYSPYDMIINNYMTPRNVQFGQTNVLGDYSSRNTGDGEIIKVPIAGDECFLLANRNKVSKWDRVMLGDSASMNRYDDNTEYGKGLYIYHLDPDGIRFPLSDISPQDMECADGYWQWEFQERGKPQLVFDCFESPISNWKIYKKTNVLYSNDQSLICNPNPYGDEISFHHKINDTTWPCWWGIGKQPIDACHMGTERIWTNNNDIYTKAGQLGDRWDAWKPGYNEVFSTYSSPSTYKWNDQPSGIFIYFESINGTDANIKIYKVGENGITEDQILAATPPSRPMGIKHESFSIDGKWCVPKITWYHNQEPDMLRTDNTQWYEVWRATAADMNHLPDENNYVYLETVHIPLSVTPHYEDLTVLEHECAELDQMPPFGIEYPLRYRVKAVDKTNWVSVRSDFVSTTGITPAGGIEGDDGDNPIFSSNTPKEFNLSQNFPNPFNPVTKINYALPKQGLVTLKIYDLLGREIKTLVNEVKQAGYYSVDFNGSALASGVYFYKIQSGDFVNVKRMVLIK